MYRKRHRRNTNRARHVYNEYCSRIFLQAFIKNMLRLSNGHRLELVANTQTQEQIEELKRVAPVMLEEWSETKKAPRHAAWLHELEFTDQLP